MAELFRSDSCQEVLNLFEVYTQHIRNGEGGDLAAFWMSYVDMVDIVLGLIRAARLGNWDLHLQSVRAMIPWLFAYDRVNYARYLPYYYASMTRLDITNPGVSEEFRQGRFSVQLGTSNPFAKIPADQAVEETINRDTQTSGGTKGFSLKPAAVSKYYLSAEFRSIALRELRRFINQPKSQVIHKDLQHTRIIRDNADVKSIINTLENDWVNPMALDDEGLVCISTDRLVPPEICKDLSSAYELGEKAYHKFKEERIETDEPTPKFHDRIPKMKL